MVVTCESSLTNHTWENKNKSIQNNWCLFDNHMYAVFGSAETEKGDDEKMEKGNEEDSDIFHLLAWIMRENKRGDWKFSSRPVSFFNPN